MRATLVAEYRKLVTTRLWWILLAAMAAYVGFLAGVIAWTASRPEGLGGSGSAPLSVDETVRSVYTVGSSVGYVFPLVIGALAVASEFRHRTVTPTLLAEPRRTVFLLGKLAAGLGAGLVFGVVGTAVATGVGAAVLSATGSPTLLDQSATWRYVGLAVVAMALWALLGVGVGTVLTNQVAVVVVVLAWTQFVEPIARIALGATSWGGHLVAYLPGAASDALTGGSLYTAVASGPVLDWWAGLLVLLGYVAVLAIAGRLATLRRDIT
ncbi:ABC transporter permease [Cellulomonas alba]|uniref:ABC transporter permease n=1 Tax=Cellulomonas alba TaxID=3053467 RepID=A0ABT7SK95_9CELL|nr:ABC transporter permease [Cellulomonas alba]MDM7856612.1 ABC transporter permease [Cellulomonas alba]